MKQSMDFHGATISQTWGVQKHVNREEGHTKSNFDIDPSKLDQNFNFIENRLPEKMKQLRKLSREKKIMGGLQSSSKPFSGFVIQTGKEDDCLSREDAIAYFEESIEFIKRNFGEDNICLAEAHFDEATPHLHVIALNLVANEAKPGKFYCSVGAIRNLRTKTTYLEKQMEGKKLELAFYEEVSKKYGFDLPSEEIGKKGKRSVAEYKEMKKAKEKIAKLEATVKAKDTLISKLEKENKNLDDEALFFSNQNTKLQKKLDIANGIVSPDKVKDGFSR